MAESIDPDHLDTVLMRASYLFETGDLSGALDRVEAALPLMPDERSLHIVKLQLLERLDNQPAIRTHLELMAERFPDDGQYREALAKWALRNEDLDLAEEQLRLMVNEQTDGLTSLYSLIRFLRRYRDDDAARTELVNQIAASDAPFEIQLMLAQFDVEIGASDRAAEDLRQLIATAGDNANRARIVLARLLLSTGDSDGSHRLVRQVLDEDPTEVEALVMLVARQIGNGNLELAVQTVRNALEEAPEDVRLPDARRPRAGAFRQSRPGE